MVYIDAPQYKIKIRLNNILWDYQRYGPIDFFKWVKQYFFF